MATPEKPNASNKKFAAMSASEKIAFLAKFVLFLCTLGFAFTHVLDD